MIIHVAIPAMNEADYIAQTLSCLKSQQINASVHTYICVNQPESYHEDAEKTHICINNKRTLDLLEHSTIPNLTIIDKSTQGNGWNAKKNGVGMARKTLMDTIALKANNEDIAISLDADTEFAPQYFQSIVDQFAKYPKAVAITIPYYHKLTQKSAEDRAILRYEIYMRNYAIQMLRINSPFAFTALGSAIAYRIKAYKAIGGMSPMKSGEDFYFLQQLKKYGEIIIHNDLPVYPAARFSNRVFFGTGPAMIKGNSGDWSSYPIYHTALFQEVEQVYRNMQPLFEDQLSDNLDFLNFLKEQFNNPQFLNPIRQNFKTAPQFARAFHTKADGLRILQYLKKEQQQRAINDTSALTENYPEFKPIHQLYPNETPLDSYTLEHLSEIREQLLHIESQLIKEKQTLI